MVPLVSAGALTSQPADGGIDLFTGSRLWESRQDYQIVVFIVYGLLIK